MSYVVQQDAENRFKTIEMTASKAAKIIIAFGLSGVVLFFIFSQFLSTHLNCELFKLSFQFLLIVVLGGGVTLVFSNHTKEKEQRIKDREKLEVRINEIKSALHKFHNEFDQSYNSVKYLRRMFRARSRISSNETLIDMKTYDSLMQELTRNQLQFEFYRDEIKCNPKLIEGKEINEKLRDEIRLIRDYLNDLVTEYENCYKFCPEHSYISELQTLPLRELPVLADFILRYSEAKNFKAKFRKPGKKVRKILLGLLNAK